MKRFTGKKSGFTLIEIIVVLIILGVLAAIALPSLFGNIGKSKGAQALTSMSSYKTQIEACVMNAGAPGAGNCTLGGLSLSTTQTIANTQFTYTLIDTGGGATDTNAQYTLAASDGADSITLTRASGGSFTCTSTGKYQGIC